MISVDFTEDELVEIANHTTFHALDDDDNGAWRVAARAVLILDKCEAAYPTLIESERFDCAREKLVLQRRVASRTKT
jgi:hypothetical protein